MHSILISILPPFSKATYHSVRYLRHLLPLFSLYLRSMSYLDLFCDHATWLWYLGFPSKSVLGQLSLVSGSALRWMNDDLYHIQNSNQSLASMSHVARVIIRTSVWSEIRSLQARAVLLIVGYSRSLFLLLSIPLALSGIKCNGVYCCPY